MFYNSALKKHLICTSRDWICLEYFLHWMDFDISLSLIRYALVIKLYINYDKIDNVVLPLKSVRFLNPDNIKHSNMFK